MKTILLTFRKIRKNSTATTLGIAGLIVGLTCVLYIFFWVTDEITFDKFHSKIERIFVVHAYLEGGPKEFSFQGCPPAVATALKNEYPEVENTCRYVPAYMDFVVSYGSHKYLEKTAFSDNSLFDLFSFPFVYGNQGEANTPNRIVLTQTAAAKYFGNTNPVGKLVHFDNRIDLTVVGVIQDIPHNSSITFDAVIPIENLGIYYSRTDFLTSWYNNAFMTFGLLTHAEGYQKVASSITRRIQKEIPESTNFLRAYKFKDGYLYERNHIRNVRIFSMIAFLILLAATLNFINLSTARSSKHARETGLRKSVGASRLSLIRQAYAEVAIICFMAFTAAILLALAGMPLFNQFIQKQIDYTVLFSVKPMAILLSVYLFTVLLAGSYPAFYLSCFSPVQTLAYNFQANKNRGTIRNSLTMCIFIIFIVLSASTRIISEQTRYMQQMDLGYEKDQLMYIHLKGKLKDQNSALKEEMERSSDILSSTVISFLPTMIGNNGEDWDWEGKDPHFKPLITNWETDQDLLKTFGAEMAEGSYFNKDQQGIVINKTFANLIGWDTFVGKTLNWGGNPTQILGVIKDIRFNSLSDEPKPMAIQLAKNWASNYMILKVNTKQINETLQFIQKTCNAMEPDVPLQYGFMNDEYAKSLAAETNLHKLVSIFSVFAMMVLCLGLLGIVMFMAEQKTKEIGIRKCMGESLSSIIVRFMKPFLLTGLLASIIAIPLTWYLMNHWLENYASHIELSIWTLIGAGLFALFIAIVTVSWQSWKTATRNPIEALRYE